MSAATEENIQQAEASSEPTIKPEDIHMPPPSYWPIILAFGFTCIFAGLALSLALSVLGIIITLTATIGWVIEPA